MTLHQRRTHPVFQDGCWACKATTVQLTPSAAPTSADPDLAKLKAEEKTLTVDGEAYKRLRRQGYQPRNINGSAHLEANASTRFEIESGRVFADARQGAEALTVFSDTFGHDALTPVTTPKGSA